MESTVCIPVRRLDIVGDRRDGIQEISSLFRRQESPRTRGPYVVGDSRKVLFVLSSVRESGDFSTL